jgi:hypothetical protein
MSEEKLSAGKRRKAGDQPSLIQPSPPGTASFPLHQGHQHQMGYPPAPYPMHPGMYAYPPPMPQQQSQQSKQQQQQYPPRSTPPQMHRYGPGPPPPHQGGGQPFPHMYYPPPGPVPTQMPPLYVTPEMQKGSASQQPPPFSSLPSRRRPLLTHRGATGT